MKWPRPWRFLDDEREKPSAARVYLGWVIGFVSFISWKDSVPGADSWDVPDAVYIILGGMFVPLVVWAAGPRHMDKLGDAFGGFAQIVGKVAMRIAGQKKEEDNVETV